MNTNWVQTILNAIADLITRTKGLNDTHDDLGTHETAQATNRAVVNDIHDTDLPAVKTVVDGIQTDLDNATDGLGALKALIDTAQADITAILTDTGTTLPATLATIAGYIDTEITTLQATATGIQNDLDNATDGLGALKALIDAAQADITAIKAVTDLMPDGGALNDLASILGLVDTAETDSSYSYTDAGGEQDVHEDTATTRRRISFAMDINAMTQGGVVKVYIKVDGTNYRVWIREDVDSIASGGTEDIYTIEIITNQNFKVTYTEDADEGAARSIPYSVVMQVLE